jgi:hypothetical protein
MASSAKYTGNIAKSFILAAERCELTKKISETQIEMLLVPAITNRAFAIELYLKALLLSENKEEEGHRLDKLFKKLTADNKKRIIDALGAEEAKFERDIESISNTFVRWRYIHEVNQASLNLDFLKNLSYAVKDVHENTV